MTHEIHRTIPGDHPSLPGHFPGSPIVPAVVILDEVAAALAEWQSGVALAGIPAVKFLAPLKPEQSFTIILSRRDAKADEVQFWCRVGGRTLVQGRLIICRQPS